jgi:flagellar biosynthetic protein FlhB
VKEAASERTEQATPRKLDEAAKRGQFPRSAEVQTVFVLTAGMFALLFAGAETWRQMVAAFTGTLGHLHDFPLSADSLQAHAISGALLVGRCAGPLVLATLVAGLLAGGLQSRFTTASEGLAVNWERLSPIEGFKRIFSVRNLAPTALAAVKLLGIILLCYSQVRAVVDDPIFYSTVSAARVAQFLASTGFGIVWRVCGALALIAVVDYAYHHWQTNRDLMMTKEEVKEEAKNTEGDPQIKSRMRRLRQRFSQRRMLLDVPKADVVITNPTHLAVALRYDAQTMTAPKLVAKGARLQALRIRELAEQHQIPIVENKPLARLIYKYGRVGQEIPAQFYAAVAEILAYVYRVNRYRYFAERNRGAMQNEK